MRHCMAFIPPFDLGPSAVGALTHLRMRLAFLAHGGGGAGGGLAFWDLRGTPTYPMSVVKAHSAAVSEVHFHSHQPDHMFSCDSSGEVWHWNGSNANRIGPSYFSQTSTVQSSTTNCIWLNSEMVKTRVNTKAIMTKQPLPVNSISVAGSSVLVAGDSEAIFIIPNIGI